LQSKKERYLQVTEQIPVIYVISDALGETAEFVGRAAAAQFNGIKTKIRRVPYVLDESHIDDILEEAAVEQAILVYTLVLTNLRLYIEKHAKEKNLIAIDVLGPLINALTEKTNMQPTYTPNILHRLDAQYFRKIEAVEFAVKYDDGKDSRGALYADVVLIGVSRTSKTPLSMYLAHKGIKTAKYTTFAGGHPSEGAFHNSFEEDLWFNPGFREVEQDP